MLDGDSAHERRKLQRIAKGTWDGGGPRQVALEVVLTAES